MSQAPAPHTAQDLPPRLVLFDGVCGFCDRTVAWLIERDPAGRLRFAPLQGETARALRARHPEIPSEAETLVFVERGAEGDRVLLRSRAVLAACAALESPPRWLRWLALVPAPLREAGYRLFARLRYRLFGRLDACRVPSPEERERFLD